MASRYKKGDIVVLQEEPEYRYEVARVQYKNSDSPNYLLDAIDGIRNKEARASEIILAKNRDPSYIFEGTQLTESDLLGTHHYEDVLYDGETNIVDVRTGKTPENMDKTVEEAKEFAESVTDEGEAPRVAKKTNQEAQVEGGSPYVASAFFHFSITGSMEWHDVFRRAWRSDLYKVIPLPDYESGDLTIKVKRNK